MALTPKKRAFADALREGASNKDAAIAAGYSASSASAAGSRLAKDPHVLAELAKSPVNKKVKAPEQPRPLKNAVTDVVDPDDGPGFDWTKALTYTDPKAFLIAAMNDPDTEAKLRVDAAKALMPFIHQRKGESGKKEEKQDAAKNAAAGRYGTGAPPLRSVK